MHYHIPRCDNIGVSTQSIAVNRKRAMEPAVTNFIPVNVPDITREDREAVAACLVDNWVSSDGPVVKEFEEAFSQTVHRKHAIAVTNGTTALELAVKAIGLKAGDEVIVPNFIIISCALAVVQAGATPVFVDSETMTWNIDPEKIEQAITRKTKAIMVAHVYHFPADMRRIEEIAKKNSLIIIEDSAEMHGQTYFDAPCGSFGLVSTFSFYANKTITTGEGGMITTNDDALAERCRYLRNLCFNNKQRFRHNELSSNYRMTSMQAALGKSQLKRLDHLVWRRRYIGELYNSLLAGIEGITLPLKSTTSSTNIYWIYGILIDETLDVDAATIMKALAAEGIGCRPFFYPLHMQPALSPFIAPEKNDFPVSQMLYKKGFYIPSGLGITDNQQERVAEKLSQVLAKHRNSH